MARDFDLGITGPPLQHHHGLHRRRPGRAARRAAPRPWCCSRFSWWAPLLLVGAWGSTHWLLRESGVWRDRNTDEVRTAQRHADYAYRLAVDAPAAKELRLFGLSGWVIDRFAARRRRLYELQWQATRLRERSVAGCLAIVLGANARRVLGDRRRAWPTAGSTSAAASVFLQTAFVTSAIAFGGLSWALDGAAAPVAAVLRLEAAMAPAGALPDGDQRADGLPRREIRFRDVTLRVPGPR